VTLYDEIMALSPSEIVSYRFRGTPAEQAAARAVLRDLNADGDPTFGSRWADGDRGYTGD
jgi:hypothetical protein